MSSGGPAGHTGSPASRIPWASAANASVASSWNARSLVPGCGCHASVSAQPAPAPRRLPRAATDRPVWSNPAGPLPAFLGAVAPRLDDDVPHQLCGAALYQIGEGAHFLGSLVREHLLVEGQEDDLDPGMVLLDGLRGFEPVHARHPKVHEDDIGPGDFPQGLDLGAVTGL